MSHFSGHFEGASTFLTPQNVPRNGSKSYCPAKKKIMSRSFLNSGTLIVILCLHSESLVTKKTFAPLFHIQFLNHFMDILNILLAWFGRGQYLIAINVPLFKKLRDIIFFWWDNHFMSPQFLKQRDINSYYIIN